MAVCGTTIILAIVILVVVAAAPLNGSFLGFYIGRCWVAFGVQFLSNGMILVLLRYRDWKKESDHYSKVESENQTGTTGSSPTTSGSSTKSLEEPSSSDLQGIEAEFEVNKVPL